MKKYLYLCIGTTTLFASQIDSLTSFQGFKGAINTPNAKVYKEGEFEFLYSNQIDDLTPSSPLDYRENKEQDNYFLNMSLIPNLDINFRFTNGVDSVNQKSIRKGYFIRDRVINLKYQIPFIPKDLFQLAIGMQDVAGGATHLNSQYAVVSKEFQNIRTNLGFAQGDNLGSLNGIFGSVEYQPISWLNIAGEYDTHDWNTAIKTKYLTKIGKQPINLGLMAKISLDYNDVYLGTYINLPFNKIDQPLSINAERIPSSITELKKYGFSNISYHIENDTIYFEYENTLYSYSEIDALGMVLGILAMSNKASKIIVITKKSNITQLTTRIDTKAYKEFLTTGKYKSNLLQFSEITTSKKVNKSYSDKFKPTLTLRPDFIAVDGSEYNDFDYTLAMQAELSMRLAKGTILSARYNMPLSLSQNFEEGFVFDYRNRHKTTAQLDQLLISQYFQLNLPYHWSSLLQVGKFDTKLTGASFESSIGTLDGKHTLVVKTSHLKDDLYMDMDRYKDEYRDEKLLSYKYYIDSLNANAKITTGEFLYGDKGIMLSLERYFSDTTVRFDIAQTKHNLKGDHTVAKLSLSIPFGPNKKIKTKYLDIQGEYLTYNRRKTVASSGEASPAQPLHLKEVDNSFTLEKYYLNNNRFHPAYIKANYNRLRNVFIEE